MFLGACHEEYREPRHRETGDRRLRFPWAGRRDRCREAVGCLTVALSRPDSTGRCSQLLSRNVHEDLGYRSRRLHRGLSGRGAPRDGHEVVGLDNFSKYGEIEQASRGNPRYRLVRGDAKDVGTAEGAAARLRSRGRRRRHDRRHLATSTSFAYDLLAENERITAASFDAAIWAHRHAQLQKITVISSSMVFENATQFPSPEGEQRAARRRRRPTASRSWPSNTSPRAPTSSTGCPTPSPGRSTASASASAAPAATRRSSPATSSWP